MALRATKRTTMMQATRASIASPAHPDAKSAVVGDQVVIGISDQQLRGIVRFAGATKFAPGDWLGIELEKKAGKNNGSVKGEVYFVCEPEHGIFVRPTAVMVNKGDTAPSTPANSPTPQAGKAAATSPPPSPAKADTAATLTVPDVKVEASPTAKGAESLSTARANAQLDLAQAMEDHDEPRLRQALAVAENLEVAPEEIAAARRMLEFEVNKVLLADAKQMRSSICQLAERVAEAELQLKPPQGAAPAAARLTKLAELLEKRVWSSLEPKISSIVSSAVAKVTGRLETAGASGPSIPVTFEDIDTDKDGFISREEFAAARAKGLLFSAPVPPEQATERPRAAAPAAAPTAQGVSIKDAAEHRSVVRSALFSAMHGAAKKLMEKKDFKDLDADGDGVVSQNEITTALADMKVDGQEAEQAKREILQHVDKDGDGVISQEEFRSARADVADVKQAQAYSPAQAQQAQAAEKKVLVRSILSGTYSDVSKRLLQEKSFQELDKDGDGRVTEQEVSVALASMSVNRQEATQATAELMQQADKDGDGTISQEELLQAKAEVAPAAGATGPAQPIPMEPKSLTRSLLALTYSDIAKRLLQEKSFKELDKDGDGTVTKTELAASLTEMNVHGDEAAKAKDEIMQIADKDGDGVISTAELSGAKAGLLQK